MHRNATRAHTCEPMPQLNYDNSHSEGLITHARVQGSALIKRSPSRARIPITAQFREPRDYERVEGLVGAVG